MAEVPTVIAILWQLDQAGPPGLQAGQISRFFARPAELQRRAAWCNQLLTQLMKRGRVSRSPHPEPSLYGRAPAYRWRITAEGRRWLADGGRAGPGGLAGLRARGRARRRLRPDMVRRSVTALAALGLPEYGYGSRAQRARRDAVIRSLHAGGVSERELEEATGLSRTRMRMICGS